MVEALKVVHLSSEVEMQSTSLDIWDKKYRLKNPEGEPVDRNIQDTYKRVAKALASVEKNVCWLQYI